MIVDRLGSATSNRLVAVAATETIQTAALAFSNRSIGLLVVCDDAGRVVGVVSKSDLVRHLADAGPTEVPLAQTMTRNIVHCSPADDLHHAWQSMSDRRLQNMPVLGGDGRPLGVLDIRDALQALLEDEQYQERVLVDYIAGVGYR